MVQALPPNWHKTHLWRYEARCENAELVEREKPKSGIGISALISVCQCQQVAVQKTTACCVGREKLSSQNAKQKISSVAQLHHCTVSVKICAAQKFSTSVADNWPPVAALLCLVAYYKTISTIINCQ